MQKSLRDKKGIITLIVIGFIALFSITFSLARYIFSIQGTGTAQIAKWNIALKKDGIPVSNTFTFNLADTKITNSNVEPNTIAPGDEGSFTINLTDTGTQVAYRYKISIDASQFTLSTGNIVFYSDVECTKPWVDIPWTLINLTNAGNQNITKTIYWKWEAGETNNSNDTIAGQAASNLEFTVTVTAIQKDTSDCVAMGITKLSECLIANREIQDSTPSFAEIANTEESSGIFTEQDDLGTTYYFRGHRNYLNNNVIFAGFQWKIIRINGNGSIRLIYNGPCTISGTTCSQGIITTGANTQISNNGGTTTTYSFNSNNADNRYVGYMYGTSCGTYAACHTNTTSSNAKNQLDTWYENNLLTKDDGKWHDMVVDEIFCNERNIQLENNCTYDNTGLGYGANFTCYAANARVEKGKEPTFMCVNTQGSVPNNNDAFTVSTSKGNGALTYPIGLITVSEVAYAGGVFGASNNESYLRTSANYWTMSPYNAIGAREYYVGSTGTISTGSRSVTSNYGLRPVINISSNVLITSGDGSTNRPYIVS